MKDSSVVVRRKRTNKIKLLVSFNGAFRRQPPAGKLRYTGGETKIISVDRNLSFPKLKGRVLDLLMQSNGVSDVTSPFWMRYHLSDSQEDRPLISLSSDDDVRSMIEEFERLEFLGKSTRLWVFVCFDCHVFDNGFVQKKIYNDKNSGVWRKTGNEGLGGENLMSPKKGKKLSDNSLRKLVLKQQYLGKRSDRIMCFKTDIGHAQIESVDENGSGEPPVIDLSSKAIVEPRSFSHASEFYRVNVLDYEYRNGTENFKKVSLSPVSKSHALNPKNCMSNDFSGQASHLIFEKGDRDGSGRLCSIVKSPNYIGVDAVLCDVNRENIVPFSAKGNVERNRFLSISSSHQLNGSGNQGNQRVMVGNHGCILYHQFGSSETRNFWSHDIFSEMENFHNFGLDGRSYIRKYNTGMRLSRNISKQWSISHQQRIKDAEGKMNHELDEYGSGGHVLVKQDGQEHVNGNKKCHFPHDPLLPVDDSSGATSSKVYFSHIPVTKTHELQFESLLPDVIAMPANHESLSGLCNNVVPANVVLHCTHVSNRELQRIDKSELEYVKELGSGTYGTVYHGKWKGSDVAIKRLKPSCFTEGTVENRLVADFWKEAHILGRLHHPNIVALYGVVTDDPTNNLATVTEYMVNGSLKQVLRKKDRTIDCRKRLIIAMDAAFGMEYLHQKNVVHFDLKSHNFLVNMRDPQRPVCKIGDLGLSKVKQRTFVSGGVRGTIPWMAPELLNGETMVSEKVDVYSFGIVMWELLTGEEPYSNMRAEEIICGIIKGSLRPEIPSWCNPAWRSLMERCWSSDPKVRPPFSDIAVELRAMASAMNIK